MIAFILSFLSVVIIVIVAIVGGYFYVKNQITSVKKFVKTEIKVLADMINDAQYNEFTFDKQNEQNIRKLEKQVIDLSTRLDSLTDMS